MDQSRPTDLTLCVLADALIFCLMTGLQESKTRGSTTFLWSVLHGFHIILGFHGIIMAIYLPIMQFMSIYFRLKTEDIINNLCYGCRLIAHEIVSFYI